MSIFSSIAFVTKFFLAVIAISSMIFIPILVLHFMITAPIYIYIGHLEYKGELDSVQISKLSATQTLLLPYKFVVSKLFHKPFPYQSLK